MKLPFDHKPNDIKVAVMKKLGVSEEMLLNHVIIRRSLDARARRPLTRVYSVAVEIQDEELVSGIVRDDPDLSYYEGKIYEIPFINSLGDRGRPLVIGSGPAGLFAGLILAEAGLGPIILERGKPARQRVLDVQDFWENGELIEESNVQFGEGGAGTFSDGKLTTRIKDRSQRTGKILKEMAAAGAPQEILFESKPHIGTANLVKVVSNIREKIEGFGGEYRFESRVDDLIVEKNRIVGVVLSSEENISASTIVLAIGHSARDTFSMLKDRGLELAPKPFSVGFRIEHMQSMIDQNQFGKHAGHPALGAADYQLSFRTSQGRVVYSFCMCPGGTVIAASSEAETVVTNGMSQYARDGDNANSAIVAEVYPADFTDDPLSGFEFQRHWEEIAFSIGGSDFFAPTQLVDDYLKGQRSEQLGRVLPTYRPGIKFEDLDQLFPDQITTAIKEALENFNRKIPGFSGNDAVLTGVETRTSCPVRILRGKDGQSISVRGIYPAGEGSGYAGGIMSSAVDGIKAAEKIISGIF